MIELRALGQFVLQGEEVDLAALLGKPPHRGEDRAVRVFEEVFGLHQPDHAIERVVVDENRSEDSALRVRTLRQRPVEYRVELNRTHWTMAGDFEARFLSRKFSGGNSQTNPQLIRSLRSLQVVELTPFPPFLRNF